MKKFGAFCERYQVTDPFPVTKHMLCCFVAYMADQNLAPQTIKSNLAGVRNMQIALGLPDPREQSTFSVLRRVQAGIRLGMVPPRVRLPITPSLLRQIKQSWESTTHQDRLVLWAICCTAFFGCFRLGEILLETADVFDHRQHLAWGDVAVDES